MKLSSPVTCIKACSNAAAAAAKLEADKVVCQVTSGDEMTRAQDELLAGGPCDYVILRVAESPNKYGNVNRARSLRQIIKEGYVSRPPTADERAALEEGLVKLGIQRASYG